MEQSAQGVSQINPNEPSSAGVGRITEGPHQMDIHHGYGAATMLFYGPVLFRCCTIFLRIAVPGR